MVNAARLISRPVPLPPRAGLNGRVRFLGRSALEKDSGAPLELIQCFLQIQSEPLFNYLFGSVLKPVQGRKQRQISRERVGRGLNGEQNPGHFGFSGLSPLIGA
jgi:hypothetical protein